MTITETQTYYFTEFITAVKSFMMQAPEASDIKPITAVIVVIS